MVCIDLQPEDSERLRKFYESLGKAVTATFKPFKEATPAVLRKHLAEVKAGRHISIALERSSEIVGHGFIMDVDKPHPVFGIGINEGLHGQGWGRRLMTTVFEKAREREVKHMTLTVLKHNRAALSLYRGFGFRIVTDHTFRVENDSYLMRYDEGVR